MEFLLQMWFVIFLNENLSVVSRCGLPVCNEACEKGHLHGNYECAIFAQAFDREGKDQKRKMPAIENMYAPCPLYTCITPLRFLLRQQRAKESKEKVGLNSCLWIHLCDLWIILKNYNNPEWFWKIFNVTEDALSSDFFGNSQWQKRNFFETFFIHF